MGQAIDRDEFNAADYQQFGVRLHENLKALAKVLAKPGFGEGKGSVGAELELYLIDDAGQPVLRNVELQQMSNDPQVDLELNRFNLECNLSAVAVDQGPFLAIENEMQQKLEMLNGLDKAVGVIPIGILPTLTEQHFGMHAMTDQRRYHFLNKILQDWHQGPFKLSINGREPLEFSHPDITLEGSCTSFQLHYKVRPDEFARVWNIAQLVAPVALALSTNSPFMLGNRCWMESRVPVFKQSIDGRRQRGSFWREQPRVSFGQGWLRASPLEIFSENVQIFPALIPIISDEAPLAVTTQGELPSLNEMNLHNGTVWTWNRPIYSKDDGGHLRIEVRYLPAGPTPFDMMATSAFLIGLFEGLKDDIDQLITGLPFRYAEYNFYRAAEYGMNSRLVWPESKQNGLRESNLERIVESLLYKAEKGLNAVNIDSAQIKRYLDNIAARISEGVNGAVWQRREYEYQLLHHSREEALSRMIQQYRELSLSNQSVTEWPIR